jgi:protoporphyrin/coproporphyrin ferrochelatase
MSRAVLLVNVGTPDDCTPEKVSVYLREFLMDPLVIDLPKALRWFLVNILIAPRRSHTSAEAYQKIWTERGSPLKFHTEDLVKQLAQELKMPVEFAMRYQNPSIGSVFREWQNKNLDEILVVPLYPQFSLSSTQSALIECRRQAELNGVKARLKFMPPFYRHPEFITAYSSLMRPHLDDADHILFSFHGLPSKQIKKMDSTQKHCLQRTDCCSKISSVNESFCYRAQSFETARLLSEELDWPNEKYTVSFQSRLTQGWIQPYTDEVIPLLARHGMKNLVVVCPSFTTDCLETLEEMGLRGRDQFLHAGGEEFRLVPCLNAEPAWAAALSRMLQKL